MNYRRAPIIEAVVEFQYAEPIDFRLVGRMAVRIAGRYDIDETEEELGTTISFGQPATHTRRPVARKLSSRDRRHSCRISLTGVLFSELAPYEGWSVFEPRILRDFETLADISGFPALKQIGMRYVNRIDIHRGRNEGWIASDFLTNAPQPVPTHFIQQVEYVPSEIRQFNVKIFTATVVSPVPYSDALILDIDVIKQGAPKGIDDIQVILGEMRNERNKIFESSITDRAREIFLQ